MHTSLAVLALRNPAEYDFIPLSVRGSKSHVDEPGPLRRSAPGKTAAFLLESLLSAGQSGISVRRLGEDRTGEIRIRRFLGKRKVTPREMAAAREHMLGLLRGRHVPVIQDTTSLRDDGGTETLQPHPAIVADAADRALRDKASRRWIDAAGRTPKKSGYTVRRVGGRRRAKFKRHPDSAAGWVYNPSLGRGTPCR